MVRCPDCADRNQQKTKAVRLYQYERILKLRHGCLCHNGRKIWPIKRIAEAMDMKEATVRRVIQRFIN